MYELQAFAEKLIIGRPILGLDHGMKRTGISMSCGQHGMAVPFCTVETRQVIARLQQMKRSYNTFGIVLGMPVNMDGTKSQQLDKVLEFAQGLLQFQEPIYLQDERLTSRATTFVVYNRSATQDKDHIAASLILDTTLQAMRFTMDKG